MFFFKNTFATAHDVRSHAWNRTSVEPIDSVLTQTGWICPFFLELLWCAVALQFSLMSRTGPCQKSCSAYDLVVSALSAAALWGWGCLELAWTALALKVYVPHPSRLLLSKVKRSLEHIKECHWKTLLVIQFVWLNVFFSLNSLCIFILRHLIFDYWPISHRSSFHKN